jgi:hypothetical protein
MNTETSKAGLRMEWHLRYTARILTATREVAGILKVIFQKFSFVSGQIRAKIVSRLFSNPAARQANLPQLYGTLCDILKRIR